MKNTTCVSHMYTVRKKMGSAESILGPYPDFNTAKKHCPIGYSVYDQDNVCIYTPKKLSYEEMWEMLKLEIRTKMKSISTNTPTNLRSVEALASKEAYLAILELMDSIESRATKVASRDVDGKLSL